VVTAIIQGLASLVGYLSAKGVDALVGKWVAYLNIAFEQSGSERAKKAFSETMSVIKFSSPEKAKAWEEWRKRAAQTPPPIENLV